MFPEKTVCYFKKEKYTLERDVEFCLSYFRNIYGKSVFVLTKYHLINYHTVIPHLLLFGIFLVKTRKQLLNNALYPNVFQIILSFLYQHKYFRCGSKTEGQNGGNKPDFSCSRMLGECDALDSPHHPSYSQVASSKGMLISLTFFGYKLLIMTEALFKLLNA